MIIVADACGTGPLAHSKHMFAQVSEVRRSLLSDVYDRT
jgi:hypothetical protein